MTRLQTTVGGLARHGFGEADRALRLVSDWREEHRPLLVRCAEAADADLALTGLVQLAERRPELLDRLAADEVWAAQVIAVLGASVTLQQHLVRAPSEVELLAERAVRRPAEAWRRLLLQAVSADPDATAPVAGHLSGDELRLAYRGGLLQIAARDLCADDPTDTVTDIAAELADLADAVLEAALAIARGRVGSESEDCRLAVVALGKCGAQELNYVSDVDVLFIAEPALAEDGTPRIETDRAVAVGTRLAAAMTRVCSAHTGTGTIWELDAALRPEGKAGPLVRSLASMRTYYGRWAKTWEFQAMLKARPAAGDLALGGAFCELVRPLVWQIAEREHFVEDVRAMRQRVVDHLPSKQADREIKLGEGGLRDVEFSVQLLQLVHGRADERLRVAGTLPGLRALIDGGYVGRVPGEEFGRAYRFMRTVEHRIQLYRLRRTHLMPEDEAALRRIGRSLHYEAPVSDLEKTWRGFVQGVRRMHERLFFSPLLEAVAQISSDELRLTTDAAQDRLRALGYADPRAALQHIAALTKGVTRQAEIQRQLLPVMLGWLADAANPDYGLLAFRQVSEALGNTPWYLRALRDEGALAQRLARILASGRYVVGLLLRSPQSVSMLIDEAELTPRTLDELVPAMLSAAKRQETPEAGVDAIRGLRRRELFRVAVGDLLGVTDVEAVGAALTDITAATIDAALEVLRAAEPAAPDLAVIAMGRWGGRELSYASDADAMMVMADPTGDADEATRAATRLMSRLRTLLAKAGPEPPLTIDTGLRPEGKGGPEIRSLTAYRAYYQRWSSTWELQALVRADALAGTAELGAELMTTIDEHRWPADGLSAKQVAEIRRLKARMEAERLPRGADPKTHLKLGPGGLSDVEWTVQLLQLQHAGRLPNLRTPMTMTALRAAEEYELISASDADTLRSAWLLASRLRDQIMLVRGKASDSLSIDHRDLAAVADLMGYPAGRSSHLVEDYRRVARHARTVVERLFWDDGS